jgi:Zn-dependent protease with chaperone function
MARSSAALLYEYFTAEQVERARRYHRPLYLLLALDVALDLLVLSLLAFGPPGDWLASLLGSLPFWAQALAWPGAVVTIGWLIGLPLSYWRGYVHEKAWGFSTQTPWGWLADRLKGFAVGLVITSGMLLGFVSIAGAMGGAWPLVVAPGSAVLVLFLSFVAPVVLEPIFNKFKPLGDPELAAGLRALSEQAGVPVRDVLVADASRRTRKENAYVSGLGGTRRVVLYDTLVARNDPAYASLVVAHELGHRRMRHVAQGTALGMVGAAGSVLVLWVLLRAGPVLRAIDASGPGDPRVVPFVLLVASLLQLVGMPLLAALSRRWESAADRFSLELTGNVIVFEDSHRALAVSNLADLDPPRAIYLAMFSHPTPPERIAAGRRWGEASGRPLTVP